MMSDATCRTAPKPKVLVLGGCGYIGRNLVQHLVENELASFVRVVDKVLPIMAYFHPSIESLFENPRVQFIQGDLTKYDCSTCPVVQDHLNSCCLPVMYNVIAVSAT